VGKLAPVDAPEIKLLRFRSGRPGDARAMAELVAEGSRTHARFLPADFVPHLAAVEEPQIAERLDDPGTWSELAETPDGRLVGHTLFLPATFEPGEPSPALEPLAHLQQLFVTETCWGSGLAARLLKDAITAARARGYFAMRLSTPADHARARRFYEREGWWARGERWHDPAFEIDLIRYWRTIT
jgi:GNAT superfamily N-acetyltransferase